MAGSFAALDKEVLVEIVKLSQTQGMEGSEGGWKDFLNSHDRKFGSSLSDPGKRSSNVLISFLNTFKKEEDLEFFSKTIRCYSKCKAMEQITKKSLDAESPEQRLVRLTIEHPFYRKYYSFPSHDEGWMVTKLGKVQKAVKSNAMIAVDCEMVLCQDGTEAVVKVCAVNRNLEVKLEKLVNPGKAVSDYRTDITGVSAKDLEGATSFLTDVQKSLKKLLLHGTILVGHSLNNDLQALKLDHARVIDTSFIFAYQDEPARRRPSLNNLCKSVLGYEVRKEGAPHNCVDDARATMKLVLAKLETGIDNRITLLQKFVPEAEPGKLRLRRIPIDVPVQDLLKIFPEYPTIEFEPNLRVRGQEYSTFAVFKDSNEADEAFENLEGKEEEVSNRRCQKLVSFQLSAGDVATICVRKMAPAKLIEESTSSKKRAADDENSVKRMRTCLNKCEHVEEVERLRQELNQRDQEITNLQKILSALTRKHGL